MYLVNQIKKFFKQEMGRRKSNYKRNIKCMKCFFSSLRNGTYIIRYLRKFFVKRYKTYHRQSTLRLKELLMVKSASFNSSESLMWKSGLVGAILGSLIPKIGDFSECLTFSAKTVDMN